MKRRTRGAARGERGAVTAELALGLPLLCALTLALVWMLAVAMAQIRAVDAARETARALARGESEQQAVDLGRAVAPPGATFTVHSAGEQVRVRVRGKMKGPGGIFDSLPGVELEAEAVALLESP